MARQSLLRTARQYNGRSRMCMKCSCNDYNVCEKICYAAFIEGFIKGAKYQNLSNKSKNK